MGLGGCHTCIKYLMFFFNFLFWLLGCVLLGIGIWVLVDKNFAQYFDNVEALDVLYKGAYVLIVVGSIVMVLGFLGCCGAIRESQCMLATFFIFLFIIFAILLAAGIWCVMAHDKLRTALTDDLNASVAKYYDAKENDTRSNLDDLQESLKCCGSVTGADDYKPNPAPASCGEFDKVPCADKLFEEVNKNIIRIAGVAIGVGLVMLVGMVFSMLLCCAIRRSSS